jgi:hypothetical protein
MVMIGEEKQNKIIRVSHVVSEDPTLFISNLYKILVSC